MEINMEKETNEVLNEKIRELEEKINNLKNEIEIEKMHEIKISSENKQLYMVINQRNENIKMLNEELNYYIIQYNKEMREHKKTKLLLLQHSM